MAYTLVNVVEISNISNQVIPVNVKKVSGSPFFDASGLISLSSKNKIVVEAARVDLKQLQSLAKQKLLHIEEYRKAADVIANQSGSSGA